MTTTDPKLIEPVAWMYRWKDEPPVYMDSKRDWAVHNADWIETPLYTAAAINEAAHQWQDIATAPRDGTRILVGCFKVGCEKFGRQCVDRWQTGSPSHYTGWGRFNETYFPATHWQPLPKEPGQ